MIVYVAAVRREPSGVCSSHFPAKQTPGPSAPGLANYGRDLSDQFPPTIVVVAGACEDRTLPFDPMVVMTPIQMVTIRANMMAYSTAVGPSSLRMKLMAAWVNLRTAPPPVDSTCCMTGEVST